MSCILGLINLIEDATLSADIGYSATLPLDNLKSYLLPKVARSSSDAVQTISANFASPQSISIVMLANHNIGRTGKFRVKRYLASVLVDDSGDLWAWPHDGGGAIISTTTIAKLRNDIAYFFANNALVDQIDITISDTSNIDGYIQIGRLFIGAEFEGAIPVEYGNATIGLKSLTEVQAVPRGIRYYGKQQSLRSATLTYRELTESEALGDILTAMRVNDVSGDVVFSYEGKPVLTTIAGAQAQSLAFFNRCFLGNFVELNAVSHAFYNAFGTVLQIDEVAK